MKTIPLMIVICIVLLIGRTAQAEDAPPPTTEQVRTTIQESIPHLEKAGVQWIETKKCITCHRISFMTWGFREASRHGFEMDSDKLQNWLTWSVDSTLASPDKTKPAACSKNPDGIGQLLLAHSSAGPAALTAEQSEPLVAALIKVQREDGSWLPAGQLPGQKRTIEETTQVSTMWNIIGLAHAPPTKPIQQARQKAIAFLAKAKNGKSTEWYAAQLILSLQEKQADNVQELIAQLKSQQQADGGWGWLTADPSDALGTGQALYALALANVKSDEVAVKKAQQFLISTQQADGSWPVKGTKENRKNKVEETATYWGTAWATIALLKTLPPR